MNLTLSEIHALNTGKADKALLEKVAAEKKAVEAKNAKTEAKK